MRHAAALVFPSRGPESLSRVLLEAGALGVPMAAMDTGGTRDIIEHERTGLLSSTAEGLARDLSRLLGDPALASRLGAGAQAHVDVHVRCVRRCLENRSVVRGRDGEPAERRGPWVIAPLRGRRRRPIRLQPSRVRRPRAPPVRPGALPPRRRLARDADHADAGTDRRGRPEPLARDRRSPALHRALRALPHVPARRAARHDDHRPKHRVSVVRGARGRRRASTRRSRVISTWSTASARACTATRVLARRHAASAPLVFNPQGLEEFGGVDGSYGGQRLKALGYLPLRRVVRKTAAGADAVIATDAAHRARSVRALPSGAAITRPPRAKRHRCRGRRSIRLARGRAHAPDHAPHRQRTRCCCSASAGSRPTRGSPTWQTRSRACSHRRHGDGSSSATARCARRSSAGSPSGG